MSSASSAIGMLFALMLSTEWLKIKIPHRRICNISAASGLILKILEAA